MARILITTVPFGNIDRTPLDLLEKNGIEYVLNPFNTKLTSMQLMELVSGFDIIIAGTEEINSDVFQKADKLKFISRVGIGLDGINLAKAKEKNIKISYTPDAPAPAVAELALALILTLLRSIQLSNMQLHQGNWHRFIGRRIGNVTIGIIGAGRIGGQVIKKLIALGVTSILVNEINPSLELLEFGELKWVSKEDIYKNSDVITLHVPLTTITKNMIKKEELLLMKKDALIINTSRGGIINEDDLFEVMSEGHLGGAAIDVFIDEPYKGKLRQIDRCILTAHMGSMTIDCRSQMEIEATQEAIRFINREKLHGEIPDSEYEDLK